MSQVAITYEESTVEVHKQSAARLGRVINIFPASKSLTEKTHLSGEFNEFNDAGIPEPDTALAFTAGGAGVMSGDRAGYAVFVDSNRDSMGNPSPISNTQSLTNQQLAVDLSPITNEYDNTRVTHIDIYLNLSTGGSTYYFAARVAIGTISTTINLSDASLLANDTLQLDNDAPVVETYGDIVAHKGYNFLIGAPSINTSEYEDDFTWSKAANADQYPLLNRTKAEFGRHGRLVTMRPSGDAAIFYKERAIYELHFDQDPSGIFGDGYAKTVNTHRGTLNKRTVADVQGVHFVMDRLGIYVFSGGTAYREVGTKLAHYWNRINWQQKEWFTAAVDIDRVVFWVALDNETECRYAFVLDLRAWYARAEINWHVSYSDAGIRDACNWIIGDGAAGEDYGMQWTPVISFIDEFGYTGYVNSGYRDLVDPLLTAEGEVSQGTTTTIVDDTATWARTNDAGAVNTPVGAYVRFINPNADDAGAGGWGEPRRITAYSGTGPTLTFTPAAPANVPAGTTYVIGAIPDAVMYSPVFGFQAPHRRKRAAEFGVEFQPGGTGHEVNLKVIMDRRATYLTRITRDTERYESTDRQLGIDLQLGGGPEDGGRKGVHAEPVGRMGFNNLQYVLSGHIGGHTIDAPVVLDAILIDGVEEE